MFISICMRNVKGIYWSGFRKLLWITQNKFFSMFPCMKSLIFFKVYMVKLKSKNQSKFSIKIEYGSTLNACHNYVASIAVIVCKLRLCFYSGWRFCWCYLVLVQYCSSRPVDKVQPIVNILYFYRNCVIFYIWCALVISNTVTHTHMCTLLLI